MAMATAFPGSVLEAHKEAVTKDGVGVGIVALGLPGVFLRVWCLRLRDALRCIVALSSCVSSCSVIAFAMLCSATSSAAAFAVLRERLLWNACLRGVLPRVLVIESIALCTRRLRRRDALLRKLADGRRAHHVLELRLRDALLQVSPCVSHCSVIAFAMLAS